MLTLPACCLGLGWHARPSPRACPAAARDAPTGNQPSGRPGRFQPEPSASPNLGGAGTMGFEPLTLHRLDMNTTGVVLFAKKKDIVDKVHAQFRCARQPTAPEARAHCPCSPGVAPLRAQRTGRPAWLRHSARAFAALPGSGSLSGQPHASVAAQAAPPSGSLAPFPPTPPATPRRKTVRKQYLALAVGVPPQQHFTVDAPIDRDPEDV